MAAMGLLELLVELTGHTQNLALLHGAPGALGLAQRNAQSGGHLRVSCSAFEEAPTTESIHPIENIENNIHKKYDL